MASGSRKVKRGVLEAMRSAGIRPELVYAYKRTGFLLDEAGYESLPSEDKAEYDATIEEYFARHVRSD